MISFTVSNCCYSL